MFAPLPPPRSPPPFNVPVNKQWLRGKKFTPGKNETTLSKVQQESGNGEQESARMIGRGRSPDMVEGRMGGGGVRRTGGPL